MLYISGNFESKKGRKDKLIHKLGVPKDAKFFAVKEQKYTNTFYNYTSSYQSGFTELDDRGTWFDLEYLANHEGQE